MKLSILQVAEATNGSLIGGESKDDNPFIFADYYSGKTSRGGESLLTPTRADAAGNRAAGDMGVLAHEVTGFSWDSRTVQPGWLYVALPGERSDGHAFVDAAVSAGATAVLVSRPVKTDVPVILVDDTEKALADLAAYWRDLIRGRVVALTGSNGKTSTKNLVRDVLAAAGSVVATEANQNNEIGVPRTLLQADADTNSIVVEMGMRGLGQIAELASYAKPVWGLVTNVGESHMELLGSRDNIARAKAELFEALPDEIGIAFVNAADDYAFEICRIARLQERGIQVILFGNADPESAVNDVSNIHVWGSDVELDEVGRPSFMLNAVGFGEFGLEHADGSFPCTLQVRGFHSVSNACSAAAVGLAAGLTLEECCKALAQSQPEQGRQQFLKTAEGAILVDDAYNANADSMVAALDTFAALRIEGRRIAVLGDMGELGDLERAAHERVGRVAAKSNLSRLVCVGDLSRHIARAACEAGMDEGAVVLYDDLERALSDVKQDLTSYDAVLVKASHFMHFERIVEGLVG